MDQADVAEQAETGLGERHRLVARRTARKWPERFQQCVVRTKKGLYSLYPAAGRLFEGGRKEIRIRDLLTMSAGLAWDEPAPVLRTIRDDQAGLLVGTTCRASSGMNRWPRPARSSPTAAG